MTSAEAAVVVVTRPRPPTTGVDPAGSECLPAIRTNHIALSAGLRPGDYGMPDDTYERYLARRVVDGVDGVDEDRWTTVGCDDGLTLRLEVARGVDGDRLTTPELLRAVIERLVETALGVGPPG